MPIITLKNIHLAFGSDVVLDRVDLIVEKGERLCFTGRNGAGKSTLLRLIDGQVRPDDGELWIDPAARVTSLSQALPAATQQTVYEAVASAFAEIGQLLSDYHRAAVAGEDFSSLQARLDAADGWSIAHRVDAILDRMGLPADAALDSLSGGWLKRVAIAQSLVLEPDVWILDEPTNHLDIETIEWLEAQVLAFPGTVLFVSHDRSLMQALASSVVCIDRGRVTRYDCDYETYVRRREHDLEVEAEQARLFDDKLKKEEAWIRQGIKARRTRNEGRVRALEKLRVERSKRRTTGQLRMDIDSGGQSGRVVVDAADLGYAIDGRQLVSHLDLIIQRGDRVGLLGPNGCGKTTLIRLLLGQLSPASGRVKLGTKLSIAYFDQARQQLDPELSLIDYIAEGREFIEVGGKSTHVIGYLGNFMFGPEQARAAVRTLSGGEQNRLLLARLFSQPANLLVLDEPTNDLDVESLELLESLLLEYDGTVLLVSHDRSFMDNVVSSLLVFEGNAAVVEYAGGYSDWASRASIGSPAPAAKPVPVKKSGHEQNKKDRNAAKKLARELEALPARIEALEAEIETLQAEVSEQGFFDLPQPEQQARYDLLASRQSELEVMYTRWEELESD